MNVIYAYPSDAGPRVEQDVLALLRARFGRVERVARWMRDATRGTGTDTVVTVAVGEVHREAAVATIRTHPAVMEAAAESGWERV